MITAIEVFRWGEFRFGWTNEPKPRLFVWNPDPGEVMLGLSILALLQGEDIPGPDPEPLAIRQRGAIDDQETIETKSAFCFPWTPAKHEAFQTLIDRLILLREAHPRYFQISFFDQDRIPK